MGIYGAAEDARRQVASDRRSWLDHLSSPPSAWAWPLRLSERALSAPAPSDERRHLVGAFRVPDVSPDRMTLHGFRTMTLTILDEVLGFRPDFIEHQLAHAVRDPNRLAYNRTAFLPPSAE